MAITTPTICGPESMPLRRTAPWAVNNDEDDANGEAQILKAAPGAGKALYVTSATFSGRNADLAITLRDHVTTATVQFGPIQMQDGGSPFTKDFEKPWRLPANTALYVYASAATQFTIYVEGFTGEV